MRTRSIFIVEKAEEDTQKMETEPTTPADPAADPAAAPPASEGSTDL